MFQKKERIEFRLLGGNEGAYTFLRENEKRDGGGVITRGGGGGAPTTFKATWGWGVIREFLPIQTDLTHET